MWESFCGDEEWRYEPVRTQHFSGWVLKLCVLFCCGHSGLLTGNTGPIVEFIVGTLCLWASSPSPARYVGDGGMWVMSSVSFSAERQRKVKMQKCQSPPARSLCARCSVASPSRSSSSRQELRGRWLGGRRPLLVLIQRSLAVREEDGEHGFIPTSRLRLQRQVCRSELTTTDMHWTDLNVRTAHMTFCTPEGEAFLSSCPRGVVCREGWIRSWSCGWGGLHPGLRGCSHRAGTEPPLPHISTWTGSAHNAPVLLVLVHQIYSNREVEEAMTKIRDVLSDDKRDWELRVAAVRLPACLSSVLSSVRWECLLTVCSRPVHPAEEGALTAAGRRRRVRRVSAAAASHGGGVQTVRQRPALAGGEGGLHHSGVRHSGHRRNPWFRTISCQKASSLSAVPSSHLSSVLGSRFDHAAEATMPILLNLVPNSAKVMATSGMAAIRLILKVRNSSFLSCLTVHEAPL